MRREYLIAIVVVALLAGGVFAVYQFYLKERLESYAEDQLRLEQLTEKYTELKEKFKNTQPKVVIQDVANRVNPWKEAVEERARYFNVGDSLEWETVPDDILSYKFYYWDRAPEVYNAFNDYLRSEGMSGAVDVDLWFRARPPERTTDLQPTRLEVEIWLGAMHFGHSFVKLFVDANVIRLRQMRLWAPRVDRQVLDSFTAGVEIEMTMEDLVAFLDKLRFDRDRFYDVNAIRIKNPYLKGVYADDPWLQIEMLVTISKYKEGATVRVKQASSDIVGGGARLFGRRRNDDDTEKKASKRSILDRIIRLSPF